VFGEVVLVVAVLAATGALTGVPPASSLQLEARPFEDVRQLRSGASVRLAIRPNQAGDNRIEVEALNRGLQPLTDVERVQLTLTMLDMQMGQREVQAQPSAVPGEFEVMGNALSMPGQWQADVSIRRGGTDETAQFGFVVGEPPGLNQPAFSPGRIVYLALVEPGREAGSIPISPRAVLALVALGAGIFLATRVVSLGRRANRRSLQLAAGAFLVLGLGLGGVRITEAYRLSLPNPEPATAQSLARGQEVYETVGCASCHGLSGRGDGPEGRLLRPRPADFRTHLAAGHTDRELFDWISNGVSGTAMPPFRDTLSEEDRWHVINYIRTFAAPAGGG
jgi:mono/diheme cytochrome c family protein